MAQKKYVSLDKLSLYDEKIKALIDSKDAAALQSAKDYADGLATNYDAAGAAASALESAKSYTDTEVAKANSAAAAAQTTANQGIADAATADAKAVAAQADVDSLETYVGTIPEGYTEETVIAYINKKAEETLASATGGSSESAASVLAALNTYKSENDPKVQANATAAAEAKSAADDAQAAADAAQDTADANAAAITAINNAETGILAQAKAYADEGDKAVQENVDTLSAKVDTLIGDDANKSVRTIANEELAAQLIPENASESLDTLQEIAAWIQEHPDDASAMNAAIAALQTKVDTGDKTVSAYVTDAIAALSIGDYAKAADLTALAGRVSDLETASATHATKTEVSVISTALDEYKDAHASDYTNAQIDAAIKVVADDVAALNDTYASDEELATAIANEVTRANVAYATKSLETTVAEHTADTVAHTTSTEKALWNAALQASDIATGVANGTIAVKGTDVAVKGLGSAAYTESSAYDVAGAAAAVDTKLTTEKERAEAAETALGARIDEFVECSETEIAQLFA